MNEPLSDADSRAVAIGIFAAMMIVAVVVWIGG